MPKTVVTHIRPDLDAIMAMWLLIRFDQSRYGDARLEFVPAGETYKGQQPDVDDNVIHVDTGRGVFDHHQPGVKDTCASELVREHLINGGQIEEDDEALMQMVETAREIDHFHDLYWPESFEPRFAFTLSEIIPALHTLQTHDNEAVTRMGFVYLDAVYQNLKNRLKGKEIIEDSKEFESIWGKGIAIESEQDDLSKLAQKMGYGIVVSFNPKKIYLKVKTTPRTKLPLKPLYDKIVAIDGPETWFYHNSGHILLTGSDKGLPKKATRLTLESIQQLIVDVSEEMRKKGV